MSIFMKMRIEIDPYGQEEFFDALETLVVPMNEERGAILQACFIETFGPIKIFILDQWKLLQKEMP